MQRYVWNDYQVKQLLKEIRKNNYKGLIVLGGPQISYASADDCKLESIYPEADVFVSTPVIIPC